MTVIQGGPPAQESNLVISSVQFGPQVTEVSYMELPAGVRDVAGSPVAQMCSFVIENDSPAYAEGIEALRELAEGLVTDVLDDWHDARAVVVEDDDEDDDRGMGE